MAAEALLGLVVLVALFAFWYGPWQEICTDMARQRIFEKRDAIFDLAADGKLSFQSHEYRQIRASLERSIRFAHELTLPRFIVLTAALRADHGRPSAMKQAIDRIEDSETRQHVMQLVLEAQRDQLIMMLAKSPVALLLLPVVLILIAASHIMQAFKNGLMVRIGQLGEIVQAEAERAPSAALKTV